MLSLKFLIPVTSVLSVLNIIGFIYFLGVIGTYLREDTTGSRIKASSKNVHMLYFGVFMSLLWLIWGLLFLPQGHDSQTGNLGFTLTSALFILSSVNFYIPIVPVNRWISSKDYSFRW